MPDNSKAKTNEAAFRIFLSSTAADLKEHREAVDDAVRRGGDQTDAMEFFGASPEAPVNLSLDRARQCDALVLIVAHRYGWIPSVEQGGDGRKSITRLEVEAALETGKPVFAYIVDPNHQWPLPKEQDRLLEVIDDPEEVAGVVASIKALMEFKAFIEGSAGVIRDSFTTPEDLAAKVVAAIGRWARNQITWPRSARVIQTSQLPSTGSSFFGREAEIRQLDEVWNDGHTNVISIIGWGGVGKSSLINNWLGRLRKSEFGDARHVYSWSFYTQGSSDWRASGEVFVHAALRAFHDPEPQVGSPELKGQRLAALIRNERTLLILDGLEPLQNPPGEDEGRIREPSLRTLVRELASSNPGLLVITSRFRLTDIDEYRDTTRVVELGHLSPEAGAKVLRSHGVAGTQEELEAATKEVDGHCLTLALLGSYLSDACEGDILRRHDLRHLSEDIREGRHANKMLGAYEQYFAQCLPAAITLLEIMGLFDRPATYAELRSLQEPRPIAGLTEEVPSVGSMQWKQIISALRRAWLLLPPGSDRPVLDAHPLVRDYFSNRLETRAPEAFREAHRRIYNHLTSGDKELPTTLEEMAPLFAAVAHGCMAGNHQEVLDRVFLAQILQGERGFSVYELGAFESTLSTLSNFFEELWTRPAEGLSARSKAFVLGRAGYYLTKVGRLDDAVRPLKLGLEQAVLLEAWGLAEKCARHLSGHYRMIGDLKLALKYAEEDASFAEQTDDPFIEVAGRSTLGHVLHHMGRLEEAEREFSMAEAKQGKRDRESPILYSYAGARYCDLLLTQKRYDEVADRARRNLSRKKKKFSLYDMARDSLLLGRALFGLAEGPGTEQWEEAARRLDEGVDALRRTGDYELFTPGLMARAAFHIRAGDFGKARADLDEAMGMATRDHMRLHEADCYLCLTCFHLAQGQEAQASECFDKAVPIVRKTGYGRRDPELRQLSQQLRRLGARE